MNGTEYIAPDGKPTGIYIIDDEGSVGIIGSADGPTSIYISDGNKEIDSAENKIEKEVSTGSVEDILNSKSISENMSAGLKIMGIGMAAVFAVLTILYVIVKIMGQFAKGKKDNAEN